MNLEEIREEIQKVLSQERYEHSLGVMEKAEELAIRYRIDVEKAKLTGLAHDIAKEITPEEKLAYVKENCIETDSIENSNTSLLHGKIGADICKKKYGFSEDMQKAIIQHTTGALHMDVLAKIIFIADKIEKNRDYPDVERVRELANENIDKAMLYVLNYTIKNNIDKDRLIHPDSILVRNEIFLELSK